MRVFGWVAAAPEPPATWDLRTYGWEMCRGHAGSRTDCKHVLLCDVRALSPGLRRGLAEADRPAWRLILLGVEEPAERAALLTQGCAEALSASITLRELSARAGRVADMFNLLPRWRTLGPLTLDLFHRDARKGVRWLHLHPREFGLLWRLSDQPGECVTRRQLLKDVWRIDHEPETNSVEVHISRLRSKLAAAGCAQIVETAAEGGYRLVTGESFMLAASPPQQDRLDRYLRNIEPAMSAGSERA